MAFAPIAYIAPNYRDYKNWWLKAYEPGTTTPKVMSDNDTGSPTSAKYELNTDGFIVSSGGALIVPHIDGEYDLYIFPTEAEADNSDTANALRVADDINTSDPTKLSIEKLGGYTQYEFNNIADLRTGTTTGGEVVELSIGDSVKTLGYYSANDGGGADYVIVNSDTSVDDGGSYIELDNTLQAEFSYKGKVSIKQFGCISNEEDSLPQAQLAADYLVSRNGGTLWIPVGTWNWLTNPSTGFQQGGLLIRGSGITVEFESRESSKIVTRVDVFQRAITVASDTSSGPSTQLKGIIIKNG